MKFLQNIIVGIFVLIISVGIFFLLVKDQKVKDNILSSSLQIFGNDLLAMVPEGEQKDSLRKKIDDFMIKVDQNQVPPEEIERVAADILNLTVQDTLLPPEEAMQVFELQDVPISSNIDIQPTAPKHPIFDKKLIRDRFKWGPPRHYDWDEKKKNAMAGQLQDMKDLHWEMQNLWQKDSTLKHLRRQVTFTADSGITVALDVNLKKMLNFESDENLQKQIEKLEREQRLFWRRIPPPPPPGDEPFRNIKFSLQQIPQLSQHLQDVGQILILTGLLDSAHNFIPQISDSIILQLEKELEKLEKSELENEKRDNNNWEDEQWKHEEWKAEEEEEKEIEPEDEQN